MFFLVSITLYPKSGKIENCYAYCCFFPLEINNERLGKKYLSVSQSTLFILTLCASVSYQHIARKTNCIVSKNERE